MENSSNNIVKWTSNGNVSYLASMNNHVPSWTRNKDDAMTVNGFSAQEKLFKFLRQYFTKNNPELEKTFNQSNKIELVRYFD